MFHSSAIDVPQHASLHAAVGAARLGLLTSCISYDRKIDAWVTDRGLSTLEEYRQHLTIPLSSIRTQRRRWGAFRTDLLPTSTRIPLDLAVRLALSSSPLPWCLQNGLAVLHHADSTLARVCRKSLVVLKRIHIRALHRALSQQPRFSPPSLDDLTTILSCHRGFHIDSRDYLSSATSLDATTVLTPAERAAAQIIRTAGGVIDHDGYTYAMRQAGFGRELASSVLRSPFICRLERAVYGFRGTKIKPGRIQAAKGARVNRFRRSLMGAHHHTTGVRLHYSLSPPCLAEGRLPIPASTALPNGSWSASFPDGTSSTLTVRGTTIRGFRPWMRRAALEVGCVLFLDVDIDDHSIVVRLPSP